MNDRQSVVSADELEALLSGAGTARTATIDVWYPLRTVIILLVIVSWIVRLLFFTDQLALTLANGVGDGKQLVPYLYFRGWFLFLICALGVFSYTRGWYPAIVYGGLLLSTTVNFLFDGFTVYAQVLASPAPKITFFLFFRVFALYLLYLHFRNAGRLPPPHERWNIFLPWKKSAV
jgi:hypothetical protein